jgi:hypothetical protein
MAQAQDFLDLGTPLPAERAHLLTLSRCEVSATLYRDSGLVHRPEAASHGNAMAAKALNQPTDRREMSVGL